MLLRALVRGIRYLGKLLGKVIWFFLPPSARKKIAMRGKYNKEKKSRDQYIDSLRRKNRAGIVARYIFLGVYAFLYLAMIATLMRDSDITRQGATQVLVFLGLPFLFTANSLRKAHSQSIILKQYGIYIAALFWNPEITMEELAQYARVWKNVKHLGTVPFHSVTPAEITLRSNQSPKKLTGKQLERAKKRAQKNLIYFMKKRLFPDAYVNIHAERAGSLKLDKERRERDELLAETGAIVDIVCISCGTPAAINVGEFAECENCGALLAERECDPCCPHFGDALLDYCRCCEHYSLLT